MSRRLWINLIALAGMAVVIGIYVALATRTSVSPAQQAWETTLREAQSEGVVRVSGPRGLASFRQAITDPFSANYGIKVEYSDLGADEVLRRIKETPANADYPWDVLVGGNDTLMFNLKDLGVLQAPIDEALILPGVKDPSKWSGGSLPYIDSGRSGLALLKQAGQYFYVDTSRAKPEDIKSYRDLLDPRWRGQMVMSGDPRDPGHGRSVFAFFLAAPGLGADFVRDLVTKQELIIPKDNTQDADRILKGEAYAMCICNNAQGADLLDSGRPFAKLDPHKVKEGTSVTSSFSNLTLPKRQAHPNAAKVYANWLLSAETGLAISQATKIASTRADVTKDHVPAQSIPDPSWPSGSDESALKGAEEAQRLAVELLGPKEGGGRRR